MRFIYKPLQIIMQFVQTIVDYNAVYLQTNVDYTIYLQTIVDYNAVYLLTIVDYNTVYIDHCRL